MSEAAYSQPIDGQPGWMKLHQQYVKQGKESKPDVVFIGDSLIQYMTVTEIWDLFFKPLNAANFGIGGDKTQQVLWRVHNGEMDNFQAKVVVLLVGTNNIYNTAQEVTEAVVEIAQQIHSRQKKACIIILGIPPKGPTPNKYRVQIAEINKGLAEQASGVPNCSFFPVDPKLFVDNEGFISDSDMFDYLHLTSTGYKKICEPLRKVILQKLEEFST